MRLSEIKKGKKYCKISASRKRVRGQKADRIENNIYVLEVDPQNNRVLASVNKMPAQWYNQSSYGKWSPLKVQNEAEQ